MKDIHSHIEKDKAELFDALANNDERKVRHLQSELRELEMYQKNHPEDTHDPTPLERFCEEFPESSECLIYED